MRWKSGKWLLSLAAFSMLGFSQLYAEDPKEPKEPVEAEKATEREVTVKVATGKHWIGVHAMPIDDALKAQLNLDNRLIIHHVLPDSPAAAAQLQTHDILVKFGDTEIHTLEDLVKAVAENDGKEVPVTVLRAGKETTVNVKPSERPAEDVLERHLPRRNPEQLGQWVGEAFKTGADDTIVWRGLGPGVWSQVFKANKPFPKGLTINVSKEDEKPAKVVATKEGKTYETTEDKLDVLPEDIREHVAQLLHSPHVMAFSPDVRSLRVMPHMGKSQIEAAHKQALEQARRAEGEAAKALRRIEVRTSDASVEALRKEVEQLRKEFQELKGKSSGTDEVKEVEKDETKID